MQSSWAGFSLVQTCSKAQEKCIIKDWPSVSTTFNDFSIAKGYRRGPSVIVGLLKQRRIFDLMPGLEAGGGGLRRCTGCFPHFPSFNFRADTAPAGIASLLSPSWPELVVSLLPSSWPEVVGCVIVGR